LAAGNRFENELEGARLLIPTYYRPEEPQTIENELDQPAIKAPGHSPDQLPFDQIGGRRFEILSCLIKQEKNQNAIVTLVKASGDKGRDVLVQQDRKLCTVVQCKNLRNRIGD
jgi:hypothetical protein